MSKKILRRRIGCVFMSLCMLVAMPLSAGARTLAEVKAEQQQLEEENQRLQGEIEQLKNDEAEKQAYYDTLQEQIEVVQKQVDTARKNIEELNQNINTLTAKLQKSQEEMDETFDLFKQRVSALYKAGDVSTLEVLLNSDSFSDFSMRSEFLKSVAKRDQELMDKIKTYMESTKDEREQCEAQKKEVAELKKGLESKESELAGLQAQVEAAIIELQITQESKQEVIAENEAKGQACISEMESIIAAQKAAEEARRKEEAAAGGNSGGGGDITYPGGGGGVEGFNPIWPMPGVTYISCYYGDGGHRGLDIAGPYGTPIVAAESGQVLVANNYDEWGDSWGYYVLIYHNGTYTTRYAHMSSLAVGQGEYVTQGQVVGYEGSTGNSTGPHLHFEVYENGTRVNPYNFL